MRRLKKSNISKIPVDKPALGRPHKVPGNPLSLKVQELNSGTEASFSFFISNMFRSVKSKNIAFRMFLFNFMITLHE